MSSALLSDVLNLTLEHLFLVGLSHRNRCSAGYSRRHSPHSTQRPPRMGARICERDANRAESRPVRIFDSSAFSRGIGKQTAIVALVLYALLPILRNTLTGILGVDPAVRESAIAMGMTGPQLLWEVELPLATRTILAGLRIATVTTIGTATIAAAIGGGGLGVFIFRGLASVDTTLLLAGAVPAALIAVAADRGLEWVEQKLSPV